MVGGDEDAGRLAGWKSGAQLQDDYAGGAGRIDRRLKELRASLAIDIMEQANVSAGAALEIVSRHLIASDRA